MEDRSPVAPTSQATSSVGRQFELEAMFHSTAERAAANGWTEDQIATALIGVATAHAVSFVERRGTKEEVGLAHRMLGILRGPGQA